MAIAIETVLRQAILRVNGIVGTSAATLQTNYTTSPLTTSQVDSADFPFAAYRDTFHAIESRLAAAIAGCGNHPWRRVLQSQTADIAHEAAIPSTNAVGDQIVGVYGAVFDSSDGTQCTEIAMDDIRIAVRNANSWALVPTYGYKIDGGRIFHTRTNVKIDVCTYNRTTQAALGITNSMLLPDPLEEALVCGITSMLVRDDAFTQQAAIYRGYYNDALNSIAQGLTSVVSKSIPVPTLVAA